jgi:hypothetical protein
MIGNHLVVCQEKTAKAFLVWPLVGKIFFVVHFLNLTFRYQPAPPPDAHLRDFWRENFFFFFVWTEHHTRKNSSVSLLIDASDAAQWIDAICLE